MIRRRNAPRRITAFGWWILLVCVCLLPGVVDAANNPYWTTNYYNITGSTIREIRRSIMRNRPAKVTRDALTEWSIRSRFGTARLQGNYRCSGFTTTTTIHITLPRWAPPEGVSDSVRQEWERYITLLKQHEVGHGQIAVAAANELHRRVASVGTDPDPDNLKSTVQNLVLQTLQEFREQEREYDRLTRHGLEQGATLAPHAGDGAFARGERRRRGEDRRRWQSDR